jgi:hypothetical protein
MSARDTGGPAFPAHFTNEGERNVMSPDGRVVPPGYVVVMQGMTLRDYFAATAPISCDDAMTALFIDSESVGVLTPGQRIEVMEMLAKMRLEYADAMLKARAQ